MKTQSPKVLSVICLRHNGTPRQTSNGRITSRFKSRSKYSNISYGIPILSTGKHISFPIYLFIHCLRTWVVVENLEVLFEKIRLLLRFCFLSYVLIFFFLSVNFNLFKMSLFCFRCTLELYIYIFFFPAHFTDSVEIHEFSTPPKKKRNTKIQTNKKKLHIRKKKKKKKTHRNLTKVWLFCVR